MRKKSLHFEIVPVEVAKKILEQEKSPARRNGKRKAAVKKSGKAAKRRHPARKEVEVLVQ